VPEKLLDIPTYSSPKKPAHQNRLNYHCLAENFNAFFISPKQYCRIARS
jgi:hypothetical protein